MDAQRPYARPQSPWRWAQRTAVIGALGAAALVLAACPARLLGLQGRLLDASGNPVTGVFDMTFDYWTCASGTGSGCSKAYSTTKDNVQVTNGLFDVELGTSSLNPDDAPDPAIFAQRLWVEITIAKDDGSDAETLSPRQALQGAPYAMSLSGGAIVLSMHEGNGAGGSDDTDANYASLTVVAGGANGTALAVNANGGDLIRACSGPLGGLSDRSCNNLRFRITNNGTVTADGSITGGGADFAEFMHVDTALAADAYEPGDVLVISADQDRAVTLAAEAYSPAVIGVYSTDPAFLGGGRYLPDGEMSGPDVIPVGIVGIVPVKVSAENGPIHRGDLLTTSATPGHAMRADTYIPGAILGKAMGELQSGTGVIEVVLLLQ